MATSPRCQTDLKYEAEGGPGIKDIMRLLLASNQANEDRALFFRSQVLFWLLAAIDGHAKNFSIAIEAFGRFRLTPLYDILSAYPLVARGQLQAKKIRMAMALVGKNKHYHWHKAMRRHFLSTAKAAQYNIQIAETLLDDMLDQVPAVIDRVGNTLPSSFPSRIAEPIFEGMLKTRGRLRSQKSLI